MKFEIGFRWSDRIVSVELGAEYEGRSHAVQLGAAVVVALKSDTDLRGAVLRGAVLRGAVLRDTDLRGAVLRGAVLRGADLRGAVLRGAVLRDADLRGADISDTDLRDADLRGAVLSGAVLSGVVLRGADLRGAVLRPIEADLYHVLVGARAEVPGLLKALREGRVDGSTYHGDCACLVGTIANVRGVSVDDLARDSSRPIERFFLGIKKGDTPATNPFAQLAEEWIVKFLGGEPASLSSSVEG